MKRKNYFLGMAAALFVITGCSSELTETTADDRAVTYQVSIPATIEKDVITRALASNDANDAAVTALTTGWDASEHVYAYINNTGDAITLTPTNISDDKKSATLTGTFTKSGGFSDTDVLNLYYQHEKPATVFNYTGQKGTVADISANFDYETAEVTITTGPVADLGDGNILTYSAANFAPQQAITKFTLSLNSETPAVSNLVITGGGNTWTVTPTTAINRVFVAMSNTAATDYTFTATIDSKDYTGTKSATLQNGRFYTATIQLGRAISLATISDITALTYNGSALTPPITVTDGSALTLGTDYTVAYKQGDATVAAADLINAGSYKAVISGMGKYTGSVEKDFTINPATDNTIAFTDATAVVVNEGASPVTRTATATYGSSTITYASDNTSVATVNSSTGEITFVGPGSANITATVAGMTNYNGVSTTPALKVYVKQTGISGGLTDPTTGTW